MRKHTPYTGIGLLALALIVVGLAGLQPLGAAQAQSGSPTEQPQAAVEPHAAPPGSRFAFFALGFNRNERVAYWFNQPDGLILSDEQAYRARAARSGRVDFAWLAPLAAPAGTWQIVVYGLESRVTHTLEFTITPAAHTTNPDAPPDDTVGVSPAVVAPRETVYFFATGFKRREQVAFWAVRPNGSTVRQDRSVIANNDGRADWMWSVPRNAVAGEWQMVARGVDSGVTRVIGFVVVVE